MMLDPHALYAVGIAVSLAVLDRLRHRFWIFALLAMPGTAAHECAHFLIALLTGGRPCSLSVIPKRVEGGYILGSVQFRNPKWWNVPFISLAPLALIGLAYWSYTGLVAIPGAHPWRIALGLFVTGSLAWGALPSGQDLSLIWKFSKPAIIALPHACGWRLGGDVARHGQWHGCHRKDGVGIVEREQKCEARKACNSGQGKTDEGAPASQIASRILEPKILCYPVSILQKASDTLMGDGFFGFDANIFSIM